MNKLFGHPAYRKIMIIGIALVYTFNLFIQGFCHPVLVAKLMLILFISGWTLFPYLKENKLESIAIYFCGTGLPICIYCLYFLFHGQDGAGFEIIIPPACITVLVPSVLIVELVFIAVTKNKMLNKFVFAAGALTPIIILAIYVNGLNTSFNKFDNYKPVALNYHEPIEEWEKDAEALSKIVPANYFMERYLGRHWKYHTRICYIYDGERPPFHDPFLNVSLDFFFKELPYPEYNPINQMLYRKLFPALYLEDDCSCAPLKID